LKAADTRRDDRISANKIAIIDEREDVLGLPQMKIEFKAGRRNLLWKGR
jgi:hypothetical protein